MARLSRVRTLPWLLLVEGAMAVREHWMRLTPAERTQVGELLRKSRGRPGNLSPRERADLKRLGRKLDPAGLGRRLAPLGGRRGLRRR
jgi:hypothetical protein